MDADALTLTHRGRVTHICVGKLTIIGSDNCLSPRRRLAIIWPNAGMLPIGPLATNFSEILIKIWNFSSTKMGYWSHYCYSTLKNRDPKNQLLTHLIPFAPLITSNDRFALTHCGLVMPYGDIDSGNGLLPDATKPLSEPMLTYHL